MRAIRFVAMLTVFAFSFPVYAKVLYVAPADKAGVTWAHPYRQLSDALGVALAGDEVWVAAGFYPTNARIASGVALYGGFAGTETSRERRNPVKNVTILDGGYRDSVLYLGDFWMWGTIPAMPDSEVVDGFTIQRGEGGPLGYGDTGGGGGIHIGSGETVTVRNCTFLDNRGKAGGAILCETANVTRVLRSTFHRNQAVFGGAISCTGVIEIRGNEFVENASLDDGSYFFHGGGGAIRFYEATVNPSPILSEIVDNVFTGNTSEISGGALFADAWTLEVHGNRFELNVATQSGGAVAGFLSNRSMHNNWFESNSARVGGAVAGTHSVTNNVFWKNVASESGGALLDAYYVTGNTFVRNEAPAGASLSYADWYVANNIFAWNSTGVSFGDPATFNRSRRNCVWQDGGKLWPEQSDSNPSDDYFVANPLMVDPDHGDFRLTGGSPCIDAGSDALVFDDWPDFTGLPRILGTHTDAGAYEYPKARPIYRIVRVSPNGMDSADGATWQRGKRTIQAAIDSLSGSVGGQVWVAGGTYRGGIEMYSHISVLGGFIGNERSQNQRHGARPVIDAAGNPLAVTILSGAPENTVLDGFTVRGAVAIDNYPAVFAVGGRVSHNIITGNNGGVLACYGSALVVDNLITGNADGGNEGAIDVASGATFANNTVVANDTVADATYILLVDEGSPKVANNIVAFNGAGVNVYFDDTYFNGAPVYSNNCVYGNGAADYSIENRTGRDGNISVDPLFVDFGKANYSLKNASPCIDAGDNALVLPYDGDLAGQIRLVGLQVDIGCFELAQPARPRIPRLLAPSRRPPYR